jgi:hypothetical protein
MPAILLRYGLKTGDVVAVFLAKSVKHPFLNEISGAQNLSNLLQTVGVDR